MAAASGSSHDPAVSMTPEGAERTGAGDRRKPSPRLAAFPVLAYGFRPFFLLAAVFAALALPLWLAAYMGVMALHSSLPTSLWHGHEMLFGYGTAVLAGFLLTATPSWSGRPPVRGGALAALAAIWLAGRLTTWAGGGFPVLAAAIDFMFLPALALALVPALRARARRNLVFLPVLGTLALADSGHSARRPRRAGRCRSAALRVALDLFVLLIALIGGRIVPAFTASALAGGYDGRPALRRARPARHRFARPASARRCRGPRPCGRGDRTRRSASQQLASLRVGRQPDLA